MRLKEAASLTGALLVRKGAAMPVQLVTKALADEQGAAIPANVVTRAFVPLSLVRPSARAPGQPATMEPAGAESPPQQDIEAPSPRAPIAFVGGGSGVTGDRPRLSLRVDRGRHVRVKVLAAHLRLRVQDILTAALDSYLDRVAPDVAAGKCACLDSGDAARKDAGTPPPSPSNDGGATVR